jgi:hypothetical protein
VRELLPVEDRAEFDAEVSARYDLTTSVRRDVLKLRQRLNQDAARLPFNGK